MADFAQDTKQSVASNPFAMNLAAPAAEVAPGPAARAAASEPAAAAVQRQSEIAPLMSHWAEGGDSKQGGKDGEEADEKQAGGLKSNAGSFEMKPYDAYDGDPGKDTKKRCGIDIEIKFTPNKALRSDQISFVQMMKADKGGTPLLFDNEKPRATTAKDGEEGWAVDRVAGEKNADYQIGNDGKDVPSWGQTGHRKSDADFKEATLKDNVRLPREAGQTFKVTATSFALDKTHGKYLGGVHWGYEVDAKGKMTKTPEGIQSMGDPAGVQKKALERWNDQADNKDVAKRNAPDQKKITVP